MTQSDGRWEFGAINHATIMPQTLPHPPFLGADGPRDGGAAFSATPEPLRQYGGRSDTNGPNSR